MDSLTQLTLGAALAEKILGKEVGRRALAWGAILGTLPDLDVFVPFGGPVADFVFHRSFSHSVFILALLSPFLAWLITWVHPSTKKLYWRWLLLVFVVLQASVFLDLMTIYGTQVLWPLDKMPKAHPVLFIIDPMFTLPILFGCIAALCLSRQRPVGHRANSVGLSLSACYLVWALLIGSYVDGEVKRKLDAQGVHYSQVVASPGPFTTLLWRVVGIDGDRYFESYYSLFDGDDTPLFVDFYPRNLALMNGLETHRPVAQLASFTRGYFSLSEHQGSVIMTDLRMGSEPDYVFSFRIAERDAGVVKPARDEQVEETRDLSRLSWVWDRVWTPLPQWP